MTNFLYRFRGNVLGEFKELENQEIFCSSLQDLNDPMEGFKDMFWSGDRIIWTNLLKNYLLCLDRACIQFMLTGDVNKIDLATIPVFEIENDLPTEGYKAIFRQACGTFFGTPAVSEFIDALTARQQPVRRDELCVNLRMAHYTAMNAIFAAYKDVGEILDTPAGNALFDMCAKLPVGPEIVRGVNELEKRHPNVPNGTERLYASVRSMEQQSDLISKYNAPATVLNSNRSLLLAEFPGEYVRLVEKITYGQWYTACFSENYTNSSMWGNYANGHRGVCLKFNTGDVEGEHSLPLYGVTGFSTNRLAELKPAYGRVNHRLHKVTYQSTYPEIDFFRSLGRLRGPAASSWYSDGQGKRSTCAPGDQEQWRKQYWATLLKGQITKLDDWRYEEEYRLVVSELLTDLSDPKMRKQKYDFSSLHGIIFGIATPETDKLAIIDIVRRKCQQEKRQDFEFSQAYYSKTIGKIDVLQLRLIKM